MSSSTSTRNDTNQVHEQLASEYLRIRAFSESIAAPLAPEDCVIQTMPDVSPTRWHLAHTTWFFETFFLRERTGYKPFNESFDYLFNSYYNSLGDQFPRAKRGMLSRPTVDQIFQYRKHVDRCVVDEIESGTLTPSEVGVLEIGLNHEQQHQELMLTDIKHVLSCNPLSPVYANTSFPRGSEIEPLRFLPFQEGLHEIGFAGDGFAYDNESPRHRVFLNAFELADRLVTAGEYLAFMADGGYREPRWWLSLGWQTVRQEGWNAPLYWQQKDGTWFHFTLSGLQPVDHGAPVCHISYFEADAYARWAGMRLALEAEWEVASEQAVLAGNFADQLMSSGRTIHPASTVSRGEIQPNFQADRTGGFELRQMFGDVWQWTQSPYVAYPGYSPADGALGEYNGKFMCGQYVLRGGSCATPSGHVRRTYRNFFPPEARWQFSGIRLARDAAG